MFIFLYVHTIHMHILEKQWKLLISITDQYYPIFKNWAFFMPIVSICHPDDLEVTK